MLIITVDYKERKMVTMFPHSWLQARRYKSEGIPNPNTTLSQNINLTPILLTSQCITKPKYYF